jgi:hypothetical protein
MIALLIGGLSLMLDASFAFKEMRKTSNKTFSRFVAATLGFIYSGTGIYLLIDAAHRLF